MFKIKDGNNKNTLLEFEKITPKVLGEIDIAIHTDDCKRVSFFDENIFVCHLYRENDVRCHIARIIQTYIELCDGDLYDIFIGRDEDENEIALLKRMLKVKRMFSKDIKTMCSDTYSF